jgi:hypothetical protein
MMKTAFLSTLIVALSTSGGFAQQSAQCRNFEATIALQMTKDGCLSQIDLCTAGTLMSNDPALSGATWLFTAHGMTETAGLSSLPKTLQYAGTVLVTAKGEHSRPQLLACTTLNHKPSANWIRSLRELIDSATPAAGSFFSPASAGKAADSIHTFAASCA